ncbi:hypothetical protein EJ03DRAFT_343625 [Teratosphaeria nubilosa]|uniref:Phytanoyl-CoA dioxygenase n=1 Tax=Teratosphaeria nubilosa TaxID=161662 RepID=A0A6G1L8U3_9PEZI|nr:hypothetical protein EJ03DRAFT_343625 [Teratosphaeria nubilosa]
MSWEDVDKRPLPSQTQKQFWLEHGFVKLPACFSREAATQFTAALWDRVGASPTDKSTWPTGKVNMPSHNTYSVKTFAPKTWAAICEILGGEDMIADWWTNWKDSYIPNWGEPGFHADDELNYRKLTNWHTDGDSFVHFLDSPEQALLVIPLFTDIVLKGGGTVICTDTIGLAARRLVSHALTARGTTPHVIHNPTLTRPHTFHEVIENVGDVYILHPFMLHSASKNLRRDLRIITNPPVALKAPFKYWREDGKYSLCEQKTLRELRRPEGLKGWAIVGKREKIPIHRKSNVPVKERRRGDTRAMNINVTYTAHAVHDHYPHNRIHTYTYIHTSHYHLFS